MSERVYQNAIGKRSRLADVIAQTEAKLVALRQELARADTFLALYRHFAEAEDDDGSEARVDDPDAAPLMEPPILAQAEPPTTRPAVTTPEALVDSLSSATHDETLSLDIPPLARNGKKATGNPKKELVVRVARTIIKKKGRPLQRGPLFEALREHGLIINGADPEMVLSTMLWRKRDEIIRLPDHGYWLAEEPYPPAAYDPSVKHHRADTELTDLEGSRLDEPSDANPLAGSGRNFEDLPERSDFQDRLSLRSGRNY